MRNLSKLFRLIIIVCLLASVTTFNSFWKIKDVQAGSIIYVDVNAGGNNDGTTWVDAFTDMQDALALVINGDEIWVAQGTYTPGNDRSATYQLLNGVALYGGFPTGGGDWLSRNFERSGRSCIS